MKRFPVLLLLTLLGVVAAHAAPAASKGDTDSSPLDDLYQAGKDLFDEYAPPEVKEQFTFPDKARWDDFFGRLQAALEGDNFEALAKFEPELRTALSALEQLPGSDEYVDWLAERLDYAEAAKELVKPTPRTVKPAPKSARPAVPEYDLWRRRIASRPRPANAAQLVPVLQPAFVRQRVPGQLVWLAEVESSFNPSARSPAGARGLYQLMPTTAQSLGLRTFLPDERTHPVKSADAAARLLQELHRQFGDWPLALAAYNAGPGRVRRALEKKQARTFAEIAPLLSVETRLYVPKVLATLDVRTGTTLP